MSSPDGPRPVGDALRAVRRQLGTPEPSVLERVQAAWADVVGEVLAAHSRPLHLRAGVLRVQADDPAWAGQFRYLGDTVVEALAAGVPEAAIRQISVTASRAAETHGSGVGDPGSEWSDGGGGGG